MSTRSSFHAIQMSDCANSEGRILVAVDMWMTLRSRKRGHDYEEIDSAANEGLLEATFAVGEDEEEGDGKDDDSSEH